jgi:probable HAF family extracellular repeat protein
MAVAPRREFQPPTPLAEATMNPIVSVRAASILILFASVPATAQIPWSRAIESVTVLPTFGGSDTAATAISELGHVVGSSTSESGDQHAFLWTRTGGMRDLTPTARYSIAAGVNDFGQVVGLYKTEGWLDRPFVWTKGTGAIDLPLLGHNTGSARAINNAGQILGTLDSVDVIWEPDGTVREVTTIVGQSVFSVVMNEFGDLAGWTPAGAFRWSPQTGFTLLDVVGGASGFNERGDVVGTGQIGNSLLMEPFLQCRRSGGLHREPRVRRSDRGAQRLHALACAERLLSGRGPAGQQ